MKVFEKNENISLRVENRIGCGRNFLWVH
jgi:hypothetical protein